MKSAWHRFFSVILFLGATFFFMPLSHIAAVDGGDLPDPLKISKLVRLNGELKQQGYYTGEFEFKLLGIVYYFDCGDNQTGSQKMDQLYTQMNTHEGLVKVPAFKDKKEELEFYKSLQNPRTGAFMADDYPLFTYIGPTLNVLEHIILLSQETGEPVKLNYPLSFLNDIDTPQKLAVFLDDLSAVGPIGAKLPKTPYIAATELLDYREIEEAGLYTFSDTWKQELLTWYYTHQDKTSGYWGPCLRETGKQLNGGELGTTYHLVKLFVDDQGRNRAMKYPLRYRSQMIRTTLQRLAEPMPENLAELHDWSLTRYQGMKLLTNFLWQDMTLEQKKQAGVLMADLLCNRVEHFFVPEKGAFGLYAGASEPDLDGTGIALGMLNVAGALPGSEQERLWGKSTVQELGTYKLGQLSRKEIDPILAFSEVNSVRIYTDESDVGSLKGIALILYSSASRGLDVADLLPRIKRWVNMTEQSMGNWESKERIQAELDEIGPGVPVETLRGDLAREQSIAKLNELLQKKRKLILVGVDTLQRPQVHVVYELGHDLEK